MCPLNILVKEKLLQQTERNRDERPFLHPE